ncbi:hypothetical protein L208DRAFT_1380563 [Tricholoma matsutake]|nr:hypothetical protein L208DRAFT_1380563 [Tricholoma matsutake 945]
MHFLPQIFLLVVETVQASTARFKSIIGVLTGDTASPVLWNIYFVDLGNWLQDDIYDVHLHTLFISHVEQADDIALFSTTFYSLQKKHTKIKVDDNGTWGYRATISEEDMDCRQLEDLKRTLRETCDDILQNVIETSSKCVLLWGCLEMDEDGKCKQIIWKLCHYLMIIHVPAHRKAFTSLMLLNHPLAVERLRWRE